MRLEPKNSDKGHRQPTGILTAVPNTSPGSRIHQLLWELNRKGIPIYSNRRDLILEQMYEKTRKMSGGNAKSL